MKIEVKIDARYTEPQLLVLTAELTDEVSELLKRLGTATPDTIVGFDGDIATILAPADIVRVFAEHQKVYAQTQSSQFLLRMRLYEAESMLDTRQFVRISNSEIVNLRKVENLDLEQINKTSMRYRQPEMTHNRVVVNQNTSSIPQSSALFCATSEWRSHHLCFINLL